jgi:hypothetical protein
MRPQVTLLSEIFDMEGAKLLGGYLVLDEAHMIKNTDSQTYKAIKYLRSRCNTCIMLGVADDGVERSGCHGRKLPACLLVNVVG